MNRKDDIILHVVRVVNAVFLQRNNFMAAIEQKASLR